MERERDSGYGYGHGYKPDWDAQSEQQKKQLMLQVKQQIAMANATELLANISIKCFEKCVPRPSESLHPHEQKCIVMCMDRFMESYRLVANTFSQRLARERNKLD